MADTRNKVNYFLEQVQRWLPSIIQDETQKQQKKQELENALRRILASGEEDRKTQAAGGTVQERQAFQKAILDAFAKRARPEISGPQFLQESGFGLPAGVNLPLGSLEDLAKTIADAKQAEKFRMAGEIIPEELLQGMESGIGPEFTTQLSQDIIKQRESAKDRELEKRRVTVEEEKLPLEAKRVAVSEEEQKRLEKELGGKIGDISPKEARNKYDKLDELSWEYQVKLGTGVDAWGSPLPEGAVNNIKSVIDKIEKKKDEFKSIFAPEETKAKPATRQKGEKKFSPADNSWYEWNGTQWILSKTK